MVKTHSRDCQCPLILRNSRISAFLIERVFCDVIENLKFLNSKYLGTLQIFDSSFNVRWIATVFLNGHKSFFTTEFTHSLNKIENICLKIYSMPRWAGDFYIYTAMI